VNEGNTVTDFDPEEIERQITLSSSLCYCEWQNHKFNFLDTPGYGNFIFDAKAALRVVECGLVVVCAVSGVEVQTEKTWEFADEFNLPRCIVINKMDRERASFNRTLDSIRGRFGRNAIPIEIPIGSEAGYQGVVDLVEMKAYLYKDGDKGKAASADIPDDLAEEAQKKREELIEMVAELDDKLLEKYFEDGKLSKEDITAGLKKAIQERHIYPVTCTSALNNIGTHNLLNIILDYLPGPADSGAVKGVDPKSGDEKSIDCDPDGPFSAFVFKTIADPYAGRISLFRVYSGKLKSDTSQYNISKKTQERFGAVAVLQGKEQQPVSEVLAGDIAAVAKLKDTKTGDTLCDKDHPVVYEPVKFPDPVMTFAVEPKSRGDEEKMTSALAKLTEEDATLKTSRDPQTKEFLLSGTGQLHVEVALAKIKKKFGADIILHPPKVPYRETITKASEARARYKKQTGGRGQFGDCQIKMEPLPRDAEFEFVDEIFGGAIPKQYIPAIEKGIQEARQKGFLAGYPMGNFRVTLFDGQFHTVDSSEMAFKIAGSMAFKQAAEQANPILLEPIMIVEITVPDDNTGDIMGDLNSRRGRVQGMDPKGSQQVIKAQVPMSEMLSYMSDLNSMTGGRGSYTMEFSHYDEVPAHLTAKIVEASKKDKEEEE
jgi:elongation factor G